ncbi:16S rRNA (uracil(1498)-N(3))-methyltransferase [Leekyejoonella antrihumi]|uniref:Ribosomal RNA small subunit methyltransferase E n=1 Tax=Leekyejoonella antrihumi TaxID=1660198 RepID=A0A563DUU0_9MICO|nr:16S rRNA (uracil(1498)-N(3))-methyltransferase [Leekyejoonella antrihumi]TWP34020.1 16S rRNA (uracil(1498)-N(3))-methyltransferase [Leekyejoonella antrihumi]
MTAPLFHLAPGGLDGVQSGQVVVLDGPEGRHAATVRRMRVGAPIRLADGSGRVADGVVHGAGKDVLDVLVQSVREDESVGPTYALVQALAKGDRDLQAVEAATELGIDRIVPWQAERSIVQWRGDRAARAHRKWETTVQAAAKQCRRSRVPPVEELVDRRGLVARVEGATTALVLHEDAEQSLADLALPEEGEVLLVVGPEGGIGPAELTALQDAGAIAVRMGSTVLRSSNAGPAALAVLLSRTRW